MLLYDMEISFRLYNCLTGAGLITTADVAAMSVAQLCNIPRLGTASMREIVDAFAALRLPMHPTWPQWIFDQRVSIMSKGRDKDEVRRRLIASHGWPEDASERAAIVAWLRADAAALEAAEFSIANRLQAEAIGDCADAISRGAHLENQEAAK